MLMRVGSSHIHTYLLHGKIKSARKSTEARRREPIEDSGGGQFRPSFQLKVPNIILARSGIAVFGLGFLDAGYSGDWSRIEVISKENEELLKLAAFVIIPLCLVLIFSFSQKDED
ncbi:uncharacterized protein LOC124938250 [Impatiens glandulifera]|uniref:uncharacterized protein LOC124938250 n=1 Tax=Impatiens glandulifera TaxID=253017 RepID=UPI001FB09883|nr:uncharacterized protein LOC124938250 [Impatiens glandulifera]